MHTPGLWAYETPINQQAAEDIGVTLSIKQVWTGTPHRNRQRGYTIRSAYQDHDTLIPEPGLPPLDPLPSRDSGSHSIRGPTNLEPEIPGPNQSGATRKRLAKTLSAKTAPRPTEIGRGGKISHATLSRTPLFARTARRRSP